MKQLDAAFIAMPGHKGLLGPQGTGLLLCGRLPEPLMQGGTGSLSRSTKMPDFLPDRGEAGTQNVQGITGLLAGLQFIEKTSLTAIRQKEQDLRQQLVAGLECCKSICLFAAKSELQTGVLSFSAKEDCEWIGEQLAEKGIAVRAGLHCAPIAHKSAGTLQCGTVRISPGFFNSSEDIHRFLNTLSRILIS